jgi:glycosyltransferase involved in cell wall biosynthesis
MRILQIIDSLEAGGAERMAVNYANALAQKIDFSGLVVSRKEGPLFYQVKKEVSYLYLNRKSIIDVPALIRLKHFVRENKVTIIQVHSTSFFLGFLLKLLCPSIKIIWHDHYGDSENLNKRPRFVLRLIAPFFSGIISVNKNLQNWALEKMHFENSIYLPNFPSVEKVSLEQTVLKGVEGKRIVCLANLRAQKNHYLLLQMAKKLKVSHPDWSFHLIGKDFNDDYSDQIKNLIGQFQLEQTVFVYGTKPDIGNILKQSTIGLLTSQSEGLPVALLEYGWNKKPIVVTAVGEIPLIIKNGINGFIVALGQEKLMYNSLVELIEKDSLKITFGNGLYNTVVDKFSEKLIVEKYLDWLHNTQT